MDRAPPPPSRRKPAALGALALLAAAASCGGSGPEPPRAAQRPALHLDPRLADGRSSSDVLASKAVVVASWSASGGFVDRAPWTIANAVTEEPTAEGRRLRLASGTQEGAAPVSFDHEAPIDAREVDGIELAIDCDRPGEARVAWRSHSGTDAFGRAGGEANGQRVQVIEPGARTLRFALTHEPGWRGTIEALRVEPCTTGGATIELRSIRLVRYGWTPGHEPLQEDLERRDAGDGGLVECGLEARRAWPMDLGVPLYADLEDVPSEARLEFHGALARWLAGSDERPRLRVEARPRGGEWSELAAISLRAPRRVEDREWRSATADLSALAGEDAEIRFVADTGPDRAIDVGAEPERAHVLLGAPTVLGAAPAGEADPRPSVLLVTMDTTRYDAVGDPARTPRLAAFAEQSIRFENAWTAANVTTPSHASMLTGLFVQDHGAIENYARLAPENLTLPEVLRREGWTTAAAVSVAHVEAGTGLGQGFDLFHQAHWEGHVDGRHAVEAVERWLEEWEASGRRRFFLWLHLFDPHTPYGAPTRFRREYARDRESLPPRDVDPPTVPVQALDFEIMDWLDGATNAEFARFLYECGVAYADALLGRVLDRLDEHGLAGDTLVAVTSDHGECLGERGIWFNHSGLFEETMHVPLYVRLPEGTGRAWGAAGARERSVDAPVATIDLAPTILAACGIQPPAGLRGLDLARVARGEGDPDRRLWFEHNGLHQVGFRDRSTHFITTVTNDLHYGLEYAKHPSGRERIHVPLVPQGTTHLFDPLADPALEDDLADERPEAVERHLAALEAWRDAMRPAPRHARALSRDERRQLEELGYARE